MFISCLRVGYEPKAPHAHSLVRDKAVSKGTYISVEELALMRWECGDTGGLSFTWGPPKSSPISGDAGGAAANGNGLGTAAAPFSTAAAPFGTAAAPFSFGGSSGMPSAPKHTCPFVMELKPDCIPAAAC